MHGGYLISVATSASGPFSAAVTTPDKVTTTFTLDGLAPSTDYFIRIRRSTYSNPDNRNTVTSDPSPSSRHERPPACRHPRASSSSAYAERDLSGRRRRGRLRQLHARKRRRRRDDGDAQPGRGLLHAEPAVVHARAGAMQTIDLTGLARPAGAYTGESIPSGTGVPAGMKIAVRLLSTEPPVGTVNAVASTNRVDVAASRQPDIAPRLGQLHEHRHRHADRDHRDRSRVDHAAAGTITIPPGQTVNGQLHGRPDEARRRVGAVRHGDQLALARLREGEPGRRRSPYDGSTTGTSLVTVVDTVKPPTSNVPFPPLQPGEVPLFLPGVGHVVGGVGLFLSDLSVINAFGTDALGDIRIYYTPGGRLPAREQP